MKHCLYLFIPVLGSTHLNTEIMASALTTTHASLSLHDVMPMLVLCHMLLSSECLLVPSANGLGSSESMGAL